MKPDDYFGPLMDDFFAEGEEHIVLLRRGLLYLEENDRSSPVAEESLRAVLRSLHTLKGLAGMVGFAEAERLAHALEDWIRDSTRDGMLPVDLSLDPLFDGVTLLEKVLGARRSGVEPLDVGEFIVGVEPAAAAGSRDPAPQATNEATQGGLNLQAVERFRLDAALAEERPVLDVSFTPSAALLARGMGVESVRGRLAEVGEILHASPLVLPGRGVSFRFLVALADETTTLPDEWREDGMEWGTAEIARILPTASSAPVSRRPQDPSGEAPGASHNIVRVELSRLEELMRLIAELVLTRGRLNELIDTASVGKSGIDLDALGQVEGAFERQLRDLRSAVMRVRLVPIGEVFERMRFVVRDLVAASGRRIRIESRGQETEVDKMVVERMMDPMLHLVRNAVSHGIESPDERRAAGKAEEGTIRLTAAASGDRITIEIEDDGRGIDRKRVAELARTDGLNVDAGMDDDTLLKILCRSGFSTSQGADRASGRGIGMDVVRSTTRALGGDLSIDTEEGRGTCFTIELPLTLMIMDALLVRLADQVLAVPQPTLLEVMQVAAGEIVPFENNEVIRYRGNVLPVLRLTDVFGMPRTAGAYLTVLVVGTRNQPIGVVVDGVVGIREIVVRPLSDPLVAVPGIQGATELPDGRVSLIIDIAGLIQLASEQRMSSLQRGGRRERV